MLCVLKNIMKKYYYYILYREIKFYAARAHAAAD